MNDTSNPTPEIIHGRALAAVVHAELRERIATLAEMEIVPGLAVILVGEDEASHIYVRNKERSCRKLGIRSQTLRLPRTTSRETLLAQIDQLNADDTIDGVLLQVPLPPALQSQAHEFTNKIRFDKDVDGFGITNLGLLTAGRPGLVACTPAGVMRMLRSWEERSGQPLRGQHAVVIGRSVTVGRPMAALLLRADCTVTICHSRTRDLPSHLRRATIVVAAAGVPELVRGEWLAPGAVVIDVGIHRREDGSLCGDVHQASARLKAAAISPVPGGVGPMTVAQLMVNTVDACEQRRGAGSQRQGPVD